MLSILIPTYNLDITALVHEVHKQSTACNIDFEILVFDEIVTIQFIKSNENDYKAHNVSRPMVLISDGNS